MANCVSFKLVALVILLGVVILHCESKPTKRPKPNTQRTTVAITTRPKTSTTRLPTPKTKTPRPPTQAPSTITNRPPRPPIKTPPKGTPPTTTTRSPSPPNRTPPTTTTKAPGPPTKSPRSTTKKPTTYEPFPALHFSTFSPSYRTFLPSSATELPTTTTQPEEDSQPEQEMFYIFTIFPKTYQPIKTVMDTLSQYVGTSYRLQKGIPNGLAIAIPVTTSDTLSTIASSFNGEVVPGFVTNTNDAD